MMISSGVMAFVGRIPGHQTRPIGAWILLLAITLSACSTQSDESALAIVGDAMVTVSDVEGLLPIEDLVVTPETTQEALIEDAVDLAIRDLLLANEAHARGLTAESQPELLQALVEQERHSHPEILSDSITEAEIDSWIQQNYHLVSPIDSASIRYVTVDNEEDARGVFLSLSESQANFDDVIAGMDSLQESGSYELHGTSEPPIIIERIANAVRQPLGVGLDVDPTTEYFWVAQIQEITFDGIEWGNEQRAWIATEIASEREETHLSELADQVQKTTNVKRYNGAIQKYIQNRG